MFDLDLKPAHVKPLLRALFDVYDIQNGAFQIGQSSIYFGLEDVLMITVLTGLPIDGRPFMVNGIVTYEDCLSLIGVSPVKDKKGGILISDLIRFINAFDDEANDETLDQACRATALLGIACMVHQEIGTTRIHQRYLHLLRDVNEIKSYAWGAASWVNLHTSMREWKRNPRKSNITGCTFALMVMFLTYIPFFLLFFKMFMCSPFVFVDICFCEDTKDYSTLL